MTTFASGNISMSFLKFKRGRREHQASKSPILNHSAYSSIWVGPKFFGQDQNFFAMGQLAKFSSKNSILVLSKIIWTNQKLWTLPKTFWTNAK